MFFSHLIQSGTIFRPNTAPPHYSGSMGLSSTKQACCVLGRSFQELKEITHIDHLSSSNKIHEETELKETRMYILEQDRMRIENKMRHFYTSLDDFRIDKEKDNPFGNFSRVKSVLYLYGKENVRDRIRRQIKRNMHSPRITTII